MVDAGAALDATAVTPVSSVSKPRERASLRLLALLLPALIFLGVFFAYPLLDVLARSFSGEHGLSLEHYERLFTRTIYLRVLLITLQIAFLVTMISLLIGYPIAYVMAQASPGQRSIMMMLVLLPFFTSMLVRTYAWMVILSPNGILTSGIEALGFGGVRLIYNLPGVLIGMVYTMLPYMVLTLYSIMKGIDRRLVDVAKSLGASEWSAFWRIYFPLSMPGVAGGGLLVFILSSGFYIVPRLMGGDSQPMLATIIAYQVDILLNWGFASALAVILLVITFVCFSAYARLLGLGQLLSSKF
jgi:putative spermidine/putrescine transport system permease protein